MHEDNVSGASASQNEINDFAFGPAGVVSGIEAPESELKVFAAHGVEDSGVPAAPWWT